MLDRSHQLQDQSNRLSLLHIQLQEPLHLLHNIMPNNNNHNSSNNTNHNSNNMLPHPSKDEAQVYSIS